jgi:guanylate kinase
VGISGAGKNAISTRLMDAYAGQYHRLVTHVTRAPRKNNGVMERNGIDYHFIDMATASHMLDAQSYIETNVYSGNIYGTSVAELEAAQREHSIIIGDIDVNGVANFVRLGLHALPVFVLPPSYEVWQERLLTRYPNGVIDQADWLARIKTARNEIQHALDTNYFYFVINDELDQAVATINAIAHDVPTERRPLVAITVAQSIIDAIDANLRKFDE